MTKLLVALFLLAHAAIHASYVSPRPPATAGGPAWPFELGRSWLLSPLGASPDATRIVGTALLAVTLAAFALAAVSALGVVPTAVWMPAVVIGSVASLGLLGLFFHPWLVLGMAIDIVLIWVVSVANWQPA